MGTTNDVKIIWQNENCPLGTQDYGNILDFFLDLNRSYRDQLFWGRKDFSPEKIREFLLDWKRINLFPYLFPSPQLVTH